MTSLPLRAANGRAVSTTNRMTVHKPQLQYTLPVLLLCLAATPALARDHSDEISEEEANAPVDAILWIHMFLQATVWGLLFPIGMVLGLSRSKWHVPLQGTGFALTIGGYFLGHMHGGRKFLKSAHGTFANIVMVFIAVQLSVGIYLKLHIHERSIRPYGVVLHGIVGRIYPIIGWTQMLFGAIAYTGCCRGHYWRQCMWRYIMGSGFIVYAIIMAAMLLVEGGWIQRKGRSPEFYESLVITLWGLVSTFSAQGTRHTVIGVFWWTGGMLGLFLSRNGQRSVIPALIVIITGWAFCGITQVLMFSTMVHTAFGYTLAVAGVTRIIEVCFIAHKDTTLSPWEDGISDTAPVETPTNGGISPLRAFRYLPPFFLIVGGLLFMSGTKEEINYVHGSGMDHVTYILIIFSIAFLMYTFTLCLIHLYLNSGRIAANRSTPNGDAIEMHPAANGWSKWHAPVSTSSGGPEEARHIIGDDDDDD
ncbi:hypothetical protein BDM02DRAFT_3271035 [Thelephora ganbajun]|uniref:Uncharacterized protein n=1 Tax=Thelephora ganbajun TaxID=370292 RepID=A0ACB6Z9U2_THEGA|nr:hypothetical protein BDM02DRAFT_3271035 [Thelephora ganbajun]